MNKQILTDIVNSILGLSKRKKKEFVELLDDGINGVSEQLNETVEQINQKINNIEPSDFEENDETKSSFIKNRPFYDYEEYQGEAELKRISYEKNYRWSNLSHLFSNKEFCVYCEGDFSNIKLAYVTNEGLSSYFIYDNTRYKIDFDNSVIMADKTVYPIINYFSDVKVKYSGEHFADGSGRTREYYLYAYFDGDINFENLRFGSEISTYGNGDKIFEVGSGTTYNSGNYFGKIYKIPVFCNDLTYLEYYESPELVHIFKQLDKKFIPDITFDTSLKDLDFSTNQASNKNLVGIQTLSYATGTDLKRLYVCRGAGQWYDSKYCYLGKDNVIKDANSQQITTFNYLFADENFSEQLILNCLIGEEEYNFNVCVTNRQGPFEYYLFIDVEKNKYFIGKQGSTYYNYITCNVLGQLKEINLTKDFVYSEIENASFIDITKVIGFKKRVNLGIKKENEDFVEKLIKNNIPDSINNRITALEQAVIALGGTLS